MPQVPTRLAAMFLLALLGILVMFGLLVERFAGWPATVAYVAAVLASGVVGIRTAKHRRRAAARALGRTCTCCTTSVHDPVQVI